MTAARLVVALAMGVTVAACIPDGSSQPTSSSPSITPSTASSTVPPSTSPTAQIAVQVFFLDEDAFNVGRPPYTRPVQRLVAADDPKEGALRALFDGPTSEEGAGGLTLVASGATGFTGLEVTDGTAVVQLVGGCSSGGSTFTIADEIFPTLRQFADVQAVKILDPAGETETPDAPGDSIPFCLEP